MEYFLQRFPGTKVQMAGSEPLIKEADPHITKIAIEARMYDKDGPKKICKKDQLYTIYQSVHITYFITMIKHKERGVFDC